MVPLRRVAYTGGRSWPVLGRRVRRDRPDLQTAALRRWRDVLLRRRRPGRLGVPLAQYLRPAYRVFAQSIAGRTLCGTDREPRGRNPRLRTAALSWTPREPGCDVCRRPFARSHHLRLRLLLDGRALSAGVWLSDRNVDGPCDVLARARGQPLREALACGDHTRFHDVARACLHA